MEIKFESNVNTLSQHHPKISYLFLHTWQANHYKHYLGIILSTNLSWRDRYIHISAKAYKTLSLLRHTFCYTVNILTKKSLYLSLVRSQLTYCSPLWHPYQINDITLLERIQHQAQPNTFLMISHLTLINLNLLPLMYLLDLSFLLNQ